MKSVKYFIILTARSPEIFAPARMPVAAGKKMANTEKKVSSSRKSGPKFSLNISAIENKLPEFCPSILIKIFKSKQNKDLIWRESMSKNNLTINSKNIREISL